MLKILCISTSTLLGSLALALGLSFTPANAATIAQLTNGENNTVIDLDQNLEWLDLDQSIGKSIEEISLNPTKGYRSATFDEVSQLFSGFDFSNDGGKLVELFGVTGKMFKGENISNGSVLSSDGSVWMTNFSANSMNIWFYQTGNDPTKGTLNTGVFQVRDITSKSVPEPTTILASITAGGLGLLAKRQQRKNQDQQKSL